LYFGAWDFVLVLFMSQGKPDYGLDAPGVARNLLIVAAAGAITLVARLLGLWNERNLVAAIGYPLMFSGLSCGLVALGMLYASRVGKVRARERLLNAIPWTGEEQVLDVGCGKGLMLLGAAQRLTSGRATGIDIWNTQDLAGNHPAATLRNAYVLNVVEKVRVISADARDLPFADGSFHIALSCAALHNIYDSAGRARAVREIARTLKPGGMAIILDIRHLPEYADAFRQAGLTAKVHRPWYAPPLTVLTMGSVRPGHLRATKAA
jgi:SAM-dependent methyltransferase